MESRSPGSWRATYVFLYEIEDRDMSYNITTGYVGTNRGPGDNERNVRRRVKACGSEADRGGLDEAATAGISQTSTSSSNATGGGNPGRVYNSE